MDCDGHPVVLEVGLLLLHYWGKGQHSVVVLTVSKPNAENISEVLINDTFLHGVEDVGEDSAAVCFEGLDLFY